MDQQSTSQTPSQDRRSRFLEIYQRRTGIDYFKDSGCSEDDLERDLAGGGDPNEIVSEIIRDTGMDDITDIYFR